MAVDTTRRNVLIGAGAVVLAGAAGGAYYFTRPKAPTSAELMAPGPLPDVTLGAPDAPVTIIEYASLSCSHCAEFHAKTYPDFKSRYIEPKKIRFVFREFAFNPLDVAGFLLARAAGPTGYFAMIELLFQKQDQWLVENPIPPLQAIAKQAGFSEEKFKAVLDDKATAASIEAVRDKALQKFNVRATPTFFAIGKPSGKESVNVAEGFQTAPEMDKLLAPLMTA